MPTASQSIPEDMTGPCPSKPLFSYDKTIALGLLQTFWGIFSRSSTTICLVGIQADAVIHD